MSKKILLLSLTEKDDYALAEWRKNGVDTDITLKDCPKLLRAVRRMWIKCNFPFESIWYGDWKKNFGEYDCVIIHGTWMAEKIPAWMKRKIDKSNTNTKIIWWYWNKVTGADNPNSVLDRDCEKWSFDIEDCKRYDMKHNTQYYFKSFQLPMVDVKNDIYFLGSDGGRKEMIGKWNKEFQKIGLKTDIHVITDLIDEEEQYIEILQKEKMSYQENLEHIAGSKAVLEILREGQSGQTLRALECLFYRKKLITNDNRVKNYDYYNKENIFILGEDNIQKLPQFLEQPSAVVSDELIEKYDCKQWLERFW